MIFAGMALGWLLSVGVVMLTLGLAVNVVWRAVMPPAGLGRGASCGSCGYELTTMQGGRCSECGADLLKAGVMTRRNAIRLAGSLPAALMGWTIIIATLWSVSAMIVATLSFSAMGGSQTYSSNFNFTPSQFSDPDTGKFGTSADYQIVIACDVVGSWGMPAESGTIIATLTHAESSVELTMDAATGEWSYTDPDGAEVVGEGMFLAEEALALYELIGLDPASSEALDYEATQFQQLIDGAQQDPFNYENNLLMGFSGQSGQVGGLSQSGGGSSFGGDPFSVGWTTQATILAVAFGVGAIIWVVGMVWIIRRRATIIRGPRPQAA